IIKFYTIQRRCATLPDEKGEDQMTEQSPTTRSTGLRPVLMVVVLGMAYFFSNFHRLSLSVIGDVIAVDYDLTSQQLATLGSAIFYSYALMQIPCGFIADRVP